MRGGDDSTSERKSSVFIECRRRNVCVGGGSGVELIDSVVKMGKCNKVNLGEVALNCI